MTVRTRTRLAVVFMLLASFLAAGLSSDAQAKTDSSKKKSKHSSFARKSASSAAIKASGLAAAKATLTEDQIFEIVVCAAIGEANRQLETALAALDEATKEVSNAS